MTDAILQFPKPGTKLTYCDATAAYDNLEDRLLGRAYGPALRPAAEMHDLLWELEALSDKFGIADDGRLASLRRRVHEFTVERTTLANGAHGERFFLRNDASRLAQHDDSGIFEGSTGRSCSRTSTLSSLSCRRKPTAPTSTPTPIHRAVR